MWQKVAKFKGAEYFRKALYIQNVNLFGAFDPEKNSFQITQRHYKIFQKLPINFAKIFQTTFVIQH